MSWLRKLLCKLLHCCTAQTPESEFQLRLWSPENPMFYVQGDNLMNGVMVPGQRLAFALEPKDRHGNPARIDGAVSVSTDDARVSATLNEDGLRGYLHLPADAIVETPQAVTVTIEYDTRLGEDVNTESKVGTVLIGPEEAVNENTVVSFGEPEDEPTPEVG